MFFLSHLPFSFFETSFMFNLRRPVPRTNKNKDKEKKRTRARNKLLAHRRWSGVMSLMARTMLVNADIWSFAMQVGLGPLPPLNSKKKWNSCGSHGKNGLFGMDFLGGFLCVI
jgi:hypothetical protein